jgi:cytochrome c-type biogenesis protein CcmE
MNRYFKFGLPIAAILGALAWLGVSSTKESVAYFRTIPEVKQMGELAHLQHLLVTGWVKEGSIQREGAHTAFLLVDNPGDGSGGDNLTVVYHGNDLPDTFKDRAQALADGKLGADGVFQANRIQAKCWFLPAEFDINKPVTLHGRVIQVEWIHPHVRIHLDVQGQDGMVVNWTVEGGTPNAALRNGWTSHSLPEGMEIAVEGYQAKDGAIRAIGRDITFADGKNLFMGSCGLGAPHGDSSEK